MIINKNSLKSFISVTLCVCLILILCGKTSVLAEDAQTKNPFSITATDLNSEGIFTVNINISRDCVLEAFKVSVDYDSSSVNLVDDFNKYGNYFSFLEKYNGNAKGICLNNHISDISKVIFTGAQPDKETASLKTGDRVAYINFKINSEDGAASVEEILSKISMRIDNCVDNGTDIVKINPEEFANPANPVSGDDSRGEIYLMGDIDFSGRVELSDVTLALKAALLLIPLDDKSKFVADIDGDGKVSLDDTIIILKKALALID